MNAARPTVLAMPAAPDAGGVIRILGIDPGLRVTGFGVLDRRGNRLTYVTSGCIRTRSIVLAISCPSRLLPASAWVCWRVGRAFWHCANIGSMISGGAIRARRKYQARSKIMASANTDKASKVHTGQPADMSKSIKSTPPIKSLNPPIIGQLTPHKNGG